MKNLKTLVLGLSIFLAGTQLSNAQSSACFTSLNDYSYAYPSDAPQFSTYGDINMDGKLDIVSTSFAGNINTLLGSGNGTFINGPTTAFGNIALVHRLKDVNADGKLDCITMNTFNNSLSVLLGTGTGSFVNTGTISCGWPGASAQLSDIVITDVNNDTKSDIVVIIGNVAPSLVSVMLGSNTGTFSAPATFTTSGNPNRMAAADMNNDGNIDLVMSCGSSWAVIHSGNGTGSFSTYTTIPCSIYGKGVVVSDFNADGKKDFAFANWMSNTISVFMGNGLGSYTVSTITNVADTPCALEAADFNNDGKVDLAVQTDGAIAMYNGTGTNTFNYYKSFNIDMNSNLNGCLAAADFNTDGKVDLLCSSTAMDKRVFILINKGAGNLFSMPDIKFKSVSNGGGGLIVDDLNGDSKQDLVIGTVYDIEVAMGTGSGNYAAPVTYTTGAGGLVGGILEADFNNDAKKDIVVITSYPHAITFMAGSGTGSFLSSGTVTLSTPPGNARVGDFNNDGNKDIAIGNTSTSNISIYTGNGSGSFVFATNITTSASPQTIFVGDFNNDGNADISYMISSNLNVILGTGSITFGAPTLYNTAGNFATSINGKDVNNDGRMDLVVTNYSGGSNTSVLLGTASGTFAPAVFFATGASPKDVEIEDVNGDGNQDLITGNYGNSDFSILLGNGAGNFSSALNYPMGRVYSGSGLLAVKDVNNDGTKDVLIKGYINANLSLGRNNVIISYNNSAVISSVGSNTICLGNTVTLHGPSNAFSYLWNPGGSTADSLVVGTAGVYSLTVANPSGSCLSTATKTITVVVCTGIENISMENLSLNIYPNPNNGDFTVQTTEDETIVIANELGQVVQSLNLNSGNNFRTSVNNLPGGVYFVKGKTANRKVVVVK